MPYSPILYLSGLIHRGFNYMGPQWCLGAILICLFIAYKLWEKTDWLVSLSFMYLMVTGIKSFALPDQTLSNNPQLQMSLTVGALSAMFFPLLIAIFFLWFDELEDASIKSMMYFSTVANSVYVILGECKEQILHLLNHLKGIEFRYYSLIETPHLYIDSMKWFGRLPQGLGTSGFLDYSGMNACLIAIGLPFLPSTKKGFVFYFIGLIAIVCSRSSVPYGVLMMSSCVYYFFTKQITRIWLIPSAICSLLFVFEWKRLLDTSGRFEAYKLFFKAWYKDSGIWFGSGPGSFQMLAPIVQLKNNFMVDLTGNKNSYFWLWAHSDWLQVYLENGVIGLALAALLFIVVAYRLHKKQEYQVLSMFCGIGAAAIFDFPLRYFIFSFLSCYAIARAYL